MDIGKEKYFKPFISSWMIIGISLVLMSLVIFQAVMNYNRERKYMGVLLKEKGAALIRSFEAGVRTGMMGMMGNGANLQTLLKETAAQPDISYIFIVSKTGKILADSNSKMIGTQFIDSNLKKKSTALDKPQWKIVHGKNDTGYFEVYKTFLPLLKNCSGTIMMGRIGNKGHIPMRCSMSCPSNWMKGLPATQIMDPANRPVIFIGMDIKPFEAARLQDIHNSLILVAVVFFLGMTGVISLFWAQNYFSSRKLLQDTRAFASETIKSLPMGIVVVNNDYHINYINDAACFLLAVSFFNAKQENAEDLLPGEIWQLRENLKMGNPVAEREIVLKTMEKKSVPVLASATDIIDERDNLIGFVFILKDLSEIKALEIKIQRKEKLAALGSLAAGIAHEVRNPLSSIKGYATFFANLFEKESENRKAAYIMAEEVDRVDRVISELLEFARPAELKLKKTDMVQLIINSLRIIKHEAAAVNVNIIKKLEIPLPILEIDPDRFTQVLLNLYINAIQAMEDGGELTVKAGTKENDLIVEICDTGRGIPPENKTSIFNPYFTTKKKGTGLGLAIVYKIIENHNGTIHIESINGSGTTFIISIPINTNQRNLI